MPVGQATAASTSALTGQPPAQNANPPAVGFQHVSAVDAWVPLFLISVLLALSMDYQVFLMSRIKDRYDQTGSTSEAVANGVASTARFYRRRPVTNPTATDGHPRTHEMVAR